MPVDLPPVGPYDVTVSNVLVGNKNFTQVEQVNPPENYPWYQNQFGTYDAAVAKALANDRAEVMVGFEHWDDPNPNLDRSFEYPSTPLLTVQNSHRSYGKALASINSPAVPVGVFRVPVLILFRKGHIAADRNSSVHQTWLSDLDTVLQIKAHDDGRTLIRIVEDMNGRVWWPAYVLDDWYQRDELNKHLTFMTNLKKALDDRGIKNTPLIWHNTQGAKSRRLNNEWTNAISDWLLENCGTEWGVWAKPGEIPNGFKKIVKRKAKAAREQAAQNQDSDDRDEDRTEDRSSGRRTSFNSLWSADCLVVSPEEWRRQCNEFSNVG